MSCACNIPLALLITVLVVGDPAHACIPPERPFLPASQDDMRAYADLIRGDFEAYIADVQDYFRCIDAERARAFIEAREVSEEYGRFIEAVE
ncbi:hypothetical protein [Phaeovulum sp. NW3]|uniref:hypothetical protein n=1 Tax=Phaeovulum sp. NW3 TaxID=2934933 RepID=UPI0020201555|nr:hypothetical protein [Phaeovulum sp. NW3]MCL7465921.1 hypothetical protein [Phaeovulum sp. NW3]